MHQSLCPFVPVGRTQWAELAHPDPQGTGSLRAGDPTRLERRRARNLRIPDLTACRACRDALRASLQGTRESMPAVPVRMRSRCEPAKLSRAAAFRCAARSSEAEFAHVSVAVPANPRPRSEVRHAAVVALAPVRR